MLEVIRRHELHRTQIIARLPGPCQSALEARFGAGHPECQECRRLVIALADNLAERPETAAQRLRRHIGQRNCPGGIQLRRATSCGSHTVLPT